MKSLFQKITAAAGLIYLLGTTACQVHDIVTPDPSTTTLSKSAREGLSPNLAQKYKLTRNGQATLSYYPDGRLKQVTTGIPLRSGVYSREYTYDDTHHVINATSYIGSKIVLYDTYYIDEQTGRCHQSSQVDYTILDKPNPVSTQLNANWYYQYNKEGRLERARNIFLPGSDRIEYLYNSAGDMVKATVYDRVAGQDGVVIQTLVPTYDQSPPLRGTLVDQYPLNASWIRQPLPDESTKGQPVPDQYLPIFGKPSPHLITGVVQTQLCGNQTPRNSQFTYQLDPAGYVLERKEFDVVRTKLLETKSYDYQITTMGVQL